MTSIRVRDIIQLQLMAVQKCALDSSGYVRKTAAHALPKIYSIDQGLQEELIELIVKLLSDRSPLVVGSAMAAFQEVCPTKYDILHPIFRRLCNCLPDVDEWGQVAFLTVFTRYARAFFCKPQIERMCSVDHLSSGDGRTVHNQTTNFAQIGSTTKLPNAKDLQSFYDDDVVGAGSKSSSDSSEDLKEQAEVVQSEPSSTPDDGVPMEPDHRQLLQACLPLLRSRNSGVVLGVVSILWNCGRRSKNATQKIVSALLRLVRSHREVQYMALVAIVPIVSEAPWCFLPHLEEFYVKGPHDAGFIGLLKLDVLTLLVRKDNVGKVLNELEVYLTYSDKTFVCASIRAVGRIVNELPELSGRCLQGLMMLMTSSDEKVVAEAVVVARTILQQHPDHSEMVRRIVRMFDSIKMPSARASVIWITSEFVHFVPMLAPEMLRELAVSFEEEDPVVKMQVVNLGVRLYFSYVDGKVVPTGDSEKMKDIVKGLLEYILELARFDTDYDLRDRVRFVKALLFEQAYADIGRSVLLASKPPPSVQRTESSNVADPHARFTFDSLSHCVGHAAFGYQPLADWPTKESNPAVRNPNDSIQTTTSAMSEMSIGKSKSRKSSFYDESDDSDSDRSRSSSDASSDSGDSDDSSNTSASSSSSYSASSSSSEDASRQTGEKRVSVEPKKNGSKGAQKGNDVLELFDSYTATTVTSGSAESVPDTSLAEMMMQPLVSAPEDVYLPLLSVVHGDGLRAEVHFSRKPSMYSQSMSHVILKLTNTKSTPFNYVKVTNMKLSPGQQLVPFPEVDHLPPGAGILVNMHVDFAGKPNLPVKFSIATDRGTYPVAMEVPCGELLVPTAETLEEKAFEKARSRLSGMHESSRKLSESEKNCLGELSCDQKLTLIQSCANLALSQSNDGEVIRGAGVKLSDSQIQVIMSLDGNCLRVGSDDFMFGATLLDALSKILLQL
eukprot:CAMPEP_0203760564 /NCGR_PEP_ID=MMETSP0098-20131031/13832_1 /ASSEMBLY_ACC=CAM_ASM_000208 /TAXON_ID=96639 /ORGANISM=" , Strain NY0313808BC1" /LENGTH=951 /DNA_ID=CAMNT_0050654183 /DNA_START=646 /DNA_END=3501 /DNA_ORIENTATION=+